MDGEAGRWMTFAELAKARGTTKRAAVMLVRRHKWRRQKDNEGNVRALVPATWSEPVPRPDDGESGGNSSGNSSGYSDHYTASALEVLEKALVALQEAHSRELSVLREAHVAEAANLRADAALARMEVEKARQAVEARISSLEAEASAKVAQAEADADRARGVAQEAVQAAETLQATINELRAGQGRHTSELEQARAEVQKSAKALIANLEADAAAKDARIAQAEADLDAARREAETAQQAATELRLADTVRKARGRLRRAWDGWRGR